SAAGRAAPPTIVIPMADPPALATAAAPSPGASTSSEPPQRELPAIAWIGSEPEARERARRLGLPLLVWARADWSAATIEMERKVWTDARIRDAARPFIALRLDLTAAEGDAQRYAERYELTAMPSVILFDARGERVVVLTGFREVLTLVEALHRAAE